MSAPALSHLQALPGHTGGETKFTCRCPAHEDTRNSLSVDVDDDGVVGVYCHAGCKTEDVLAMNGLKMGDLFPPKVPKQPKRIVCDYVYLGADGIPVGRVVRYQPKDFRQERYESGRFIPKLNGITLPVYRYPEVLKAKAEGCPVYFCEGEKDVDALTALGVTATTIAGGAAQALHDSHVEALMGCDLIVLPDNDPAGIKAARARADAVWGSTYLMLPGLPPKGDVSDWIAQGGTLEALQALVERARENPEAEVEEAPQSLLPPFADLMKTFDLGLLEVPMLFENAMPMGELAVIASEPGAGKTTLTIGLALSVVFGRTFVSGFVPKFRGRVCMLLAEDMEIPCSTRIMSWCAAHGVGREEYERAVDDGRLYARYGESAQLLDFTGGTLRTTAHYDELLQEVEANKYDLLVVDSLIEWAGVSEENAAAQMHLAARALIRLARASGGVVLALHHTNKNSDRTGDTGLHSIRGSGSLAGKVRWATVLSALTPKEMKEYGVPEEDKYLYLRLHNVKQQYAAREGKPVFLERTNGVLEVKSLLKPNAEDNFAPLARALADKIGHNPDDTTKRIILKDADLRADLKLKHRDATRDNVAAAYSLAVKRGWLVEEVTETSGTPSIIPRIPASEAAQWAST